MVVWVSILLGHCHGADDSELPRRRPPGRGLGISPLTMSWRMVHPTTMGFRPNHLTHVIGSEPSAR